MGGRKGGGGESEFCETEGDSFGNGIVSGEVINSDSESMRAEHNRKRTHDNTLDIPDGIFKSACTLDGGASQKKRATKVLRFDVLTAGTSLTDCLLAIGLARRGMRVLQCDRDDFYGGCHSSLPLHKLLEWVAEDKYKSDCFTAPASPDSCSSPRAVGSLGLTRLEEHQAHSLAESLGVDASLLSTHCTAADKCLEEKECTRKVEQRDERNEEEGKIIHKAKNSSSWWVLRAHPQSHSSSSASWLSGDGQVESSGIQTDPQVADPSSLLPPLFTIDPNRCFTHRWYSFSPFDEKEIEAKEETDGMVLQQQQQIKPCGRRLEGDGKAGKKTDGGTSSSDTSSSQSSVPEPRTSEIVATSVTTSSQSPSQSSNDLCGTGEQITPSAGLDSEKPGGEVASSMMKSKHRFAFDLLPRMIYAASPIVDILRASECATYLDFRTMDAPLMVGCISAGGKVSPNSSRKVEKLIEKVDQADSALPGTLIDVSDTSIRSYTQALTSNKELNLEFVPTSKGEVFAHPQLSLIEKRLLTRFFSSVACEIQSSRFITPAKMTKFRSSKTTNVDSSSLDSSSTPSEDTWSAFLTSSGLTPRLSNYLTYGVCSCDLPTSEALVGGDREAPDRRISRFIGSKPIEEWSKKSALLRLSLFIQSLTAFQSLKGPWLFPFYGTADIPQALTRGAALSEAVFMLRKSIAELVFEEKGGENRILERTDIDSREIHSCTDACKADGMEQNLCVSSFLRRLRLSAIRFSTGEVIGARLFALTLDSLPSLHTPVKIRGLKNISSCDHALSTNDSCVGSPDVIIPLESLLFPQCSRKSPQPLSSPTSFGESNHSDTCHSHHEQYACHLVAVCTMNVLDTVTSLSREQSRTAHSPTSPVGSFAVAVVCDEKSSHSSLSPSASPSPPRPYFNSSPVHVVQSGAMTGTAPPGHCIVHLSHLTNAACFKPLPSCGNLPDILTRDEFGDPRSSLLFCTSSPESISASNASSKFQHPYSFNRICTCPDAEISAKSCNTSQDHKDNPIMNESGGFPLEPRDEGTCRACKGFLGCPVLLRVLHLLLKRSEREGQKCLFTCGYRYHSRLSSPKISLQAQAFATEAPPSIIDQESKAEPEDPVENPAVAFPASSTSPSTDSRSSSGIEVSHRVPLHEGIILIPDPPASGSFGLLSEANQFQDILSQCLGHSIAVQKTGDCLSNTRDSAMSDPLCGSGSDDASDSIAPSQSNLLDTASLVPPRKKSDYVKRLEQGDESDCQSQDSDFDSREEDAVAEAQADLGRDEKMDVQALEARGISSSQ